MLQRLMTRWRLLLLSSFVFTNESYDVLVMLFLDVLNMGFNDLDVHIIVEFTENRRRWCVKRAVFGGYNRALQRRIWQRAASSS